MSMNAGQAPKFTNPIRGAFWLFVVIIALLPRSLDLDVFYARDELAIWPWADQFALAIWAGDWAGTLTASDYPGIPLFWSQTIFLTIKYTFPGLFQNTLIPLDLLFDDRTLPLLAERRLVVGIFVTVQIVAVVWLVRRLWGWKIALLSAIFLSLDPFSLTEARLVRLEMISAMFVCLSVLTYLLYLNERQRRWVIGSGVMAGLAVSAKTSGGLIVPYIWILLLVDFFFTTTVVAEDQSNVWLAKFKQMISNGLLWAGGAIVAFWAIWPAMWIQPWTTIQYVFQAGLGQAANRSVWGDRVFFWGEVWPGDPGPFFYPVVYAFRTTPFTWLGAGLALGWLILQIVNRQKNVSDASLPSQAALLLTFVLLITLELSLVISKVDRFLLIVFPILNILSALGWVIGLGWLSQWLAQRIERPTVSIPLFGLATLVIFLLHLNLTWAVHPHYFTYWNPWAGGGQAAMEAVPIGAGEGIDEAMNYLNEQPNAATSSVICGASHPWCQQIFVGETMRSATYASGEWANADYATFYISHMQRQINPPEVVDFFLNREPLYRVELQDVTYVWLYQVPDVGQFAGAWNDLAGQGRLLGYDFGDAVQAVGDPLETTVWWINRGAGVDNLVVRWLDQSGYEWGRAKVVPAPEYAAIPAEKDAVLSGQASFVFPPGTPPGTYFLRIGVVADDKILGEFEMPDGTNQVVLERGPHPLMEPDLVNIPHRLADALAPEITLLGYTPPAQLLTATAPTWLTLYWQAMAIAPDYIVQLRLLDKGGEVVAHWQGQPGQGQYPMGAWAEGEIVQDVWPLQVEPTLPIGLYDLEISLLNPDGTQIENRKSKIENLQVWPQPINYDIPEMQTVIQTQVGAALTLLGYDLYFDTDGSGAGLLTPVFYWQSQLEGQAAFDLVLTLKSADTEQVVQTWQVPLGGEQAKTYWKMDEVLNTAYQFDGGALVGGRYHLDVAVQNRASGQFEAINGSLDPGFIRIADIQDQIVVRVIE